MKHDQQNTEKNTDVLWMVKNIAYVATISILLGLIITYIFSPPKYYILQAVQHDGPNCLYIYTCGQDTFKWPDRCDVPAEVGDTLVYDIQQTLRR